MDRDLHREELQTLLESVSGVSEVYFQPPAGMQMVYPCFVYERDDVRTIYADNNPYRRKKRYQVTVIDRNPDSAIPDKIAGLPYCEFSTHFKKDNLNHDVYSLFF